MLKSLGNTRIQNLHVGFKAGKLDPDPREVRYRRMPINPDSEEYVQDP